MFGNWIKTVLLFTGIVALFGVTGLALGGATGMLLGLVFAAATNLWAYWNSDRLVLRLTQAEEVDAASAPTLYGLVAELARRAGLPMPRVFVIEEDQPNTFATGRDPQRAAVAVTTGILRRLTVRELRGGLAHLFSTHPPVGERVARLLALSRGGG